MRKYFTEYQCIMILKRCVERVAPLGRVGEGTFTSSVCVWPILLQRSRVRRPLA